jgi:hypothetical protein
MAMFFALIWCGLLWPVANVFRKLSLNLYLSLIIYLVISGRIPLPFLQLQFNLSDVVILLFSVCWLLPFAPKMVFGSFSGFKRSGSYRYSFKRLDVADVFLLLYPITLLSAALVFDQGNILYIACAFAITGVVIYAKSQSNRNHALVKYAVQDAILISTIIISIFAIAAQLLIAIHVFDCQQFAPFHPDSDVHCVPFGGLFEVYRFSMGSNINEFVLYLLMSYMILSNRINPLTGEYSFAHGYRFNSLICWLLRIGIIACSFLALSRAWMVGILAFYSISMFGKFTHWLVSPNSSIRFFSIFKKPKTLFLLVLSIILLVNVLPFFYTQFETLLVSRFSFLVEPESLFEGTSSQDRIETLSAFLDKIHQFSWFPVLPAGAGTALHNSFIQFYLEAGLAIAIFGLIILLYSCISSLALTVPVILFMLFHHVLYNPVLWLYLFSVTGFVVPTRVAMAYVIPKYS